MCSCPFRIDKYCMISKLDQRGRKMERSKWINTFVRGPKPSADDLSRLVSQDNPENGIDKMKPSKGVLATTGILELPDYDPLPKPIYLGNQ